MIGRALELLGCLTVVVLALIGLLWLAIAFEEHLADRKEFEAGE